MQGKQRAFLDRLRQPHSLSWLVLSGAVWAVLGVYLAGNPAQTMPSDSAYLHVGGYAGFLNAEAVNSLLYPLLLWPAPTALALFWGGVAHLGATWLVYLLLSARDTPAMSALLLALAYGLSGPLIWGALSGTPVSLLVCLMLLALYLYQTERYPAALLVSLPAPFIALEGALVVWMLLLAVYTRRRENPLTERWLARYGPVVMLLPLLALVGYGLLTGSPWPADIHAHSYLTDPALAWGERLNASSRQLSFIWQELATGWSVEDGWYMLPLLTIPALLALIYSVRTSLDKGQFSAGMLVLLWMLALSSYHATLDNAFEDFKRSQLPFMALMFPLGGWFLGQIEHQFDEWSSNKWLFRIFAGAILLLSLYTAVEFGLRYALNTGRMQSQALVVADWAREDVPAEALIASDTPASLAHETDRRPYAIPYDTVYRLGPGAVYEALQRARPAYLALHVDDPALAGLGEVLLPQAQRLPGAPERWAVGPGGSLWYGAADYRGALGLDILSQLDVSALVGGSPLRRVVNVADLPSEAAANYRADVDEDAPTRVVVASYADCLAEPCTLAEGVRQVVGEERFNTGPAGPYLVVARVYATLDAQQVRVGCQASEVYTVPALDGAWVELAFPDIGTEFCLSAEGLYQPARYWVYDQPLRLTD